MSRARKDHRPSGNSEASTSSQRREALDDYIMEAAAKRGKQMGSKRSLKPTQVGIAIGMMRHDYKKNKGVLVRRFPSIKMYFHPDCKYKTVLSLTKDRVFSGGEEGHGYYLAEGSGAPVCNNGTDITLYDEEGKCKSLPWTVSNYLSVNNIYLSKARLYCVEKIPSMASPTTTPKEDGSGNFATDAIASPVPSDIEDDGTLSDIGQEVIITSGLVSQPVHSMSPSPPNPKRIKQDLDDDVPPFMVYFGLRGERNHPVSGRNYWFRSNMTRESILSTSDSIIGHNNPLISLGSDAFIEQIETSHTTYSFVSSLDSETGLITLKTPGPDDSFCTWSGCMTSQETGVSTLVFVALNGYHGVAQYIWVLNNKEQLDNEAHPIIYTECTGVLGCTITTPNIEARKEFHIRIEGGRKVIVEGATHTNWLSEQSTMISDSQAKEKLALLRENLTGLSDGNELMIISEIGRGNYGVVSKALWRGVVVAAKVIPGASSLKEANILSKLHHPNIVGILDVSVANGQVTIVMPLVEGCSLYSMIFDFKHPRMDEVQKLYIIVQIAQALFYLHTSNPALVHSDVKPSNILVEAATDKAYLTDFGVSKLAIPAASQTIQQVQGTPAFLSPENLTAKDNSPAGDVYAFGGVLVELFSEIPIWEGLTPFQIITKVVVLKETPDTKDLPPGVQKICTQCFKSVQERPGISEILQSLLNVNV